MNPTPEPTPPHDHADCPDIIRQVFADRRAEVTVSTQPPLVRGEYETGCYTCPHGVMYFVEPTGEQIARWARDGVK